MTELSVAEVLERAADLIEPEGAWTQGAFARNAQGKDTGLSESRGPATCWCVLGATDHVSGEDDPVVQADHLLAQVIGGAAHNGLGEWNDAPGRTQSEVVAKLREAAALARQSALQKGASHA